MTRIDGKKKNPCKFKGLSKPEAGLELFEADSR